MKQRSTMQIFFGVLLAVVGLVNVYHFAAERKSASAVLAAISAMAGALIIHTSTAAARRK